VNQTKMQILVGIDFSESSRLALLRAAELALRTSARLHLCHIACTDGLIADTNLGLNIPEDFPAARAARSDLQRMLAGLGAAIDGELHVRMSTSPLNGMMALIKELKPDLVMVGSHGKGVLKRALLGSLSAQLSQHSPVTVAIVPAPGREQLLHQTASPPEIELPAVGHAVADSAGGYGVAGVGSGDVLIR
jgi:nucleotide-binding universal stress UspA family protein